MKCPRCQHENPQEARFCEECATPLARTCSNCGTSLSATAKFCHACAHPVARGAGTPSRSPDSYTPKHLAEKILTSKAALEGERKQVTVLFADLKGSMELLADRDPEGRCALGNPFDEADQPRADVQHVSEKERERTDRHLAREVVEQAHDAEPPNRRAQARARDLARN